MVRTIIEELLQMDQTNFFEEIAENWIENKLSYCRMVISEEWQFGQVQWATNNE